MFALPQGVSYSQKYRVKRVFLITLRLQFSNLGQTKLRYVIDIQLNMFLRLIIDPYSNCIFTGVNQAKIYFQYSFRLV